MKNKWMSLSAIAALIGMTYIVTFFIQQIQQHGPMALVLLKGLL